MMRATREALEAERARRQYGTITEHDPMCGSLSGRACNCTVAWIAAAFAEVAAHEALEDAARAWASATETTTVIISERRLREALRALDATGKETT
jgi:hypothetical protein